MSGVIYMDTSALAKWYVNESRSDEVDEYIRQNAPMRISDLTVVEMRSLLARRRREGRISSNNEMEAFANFQEDMRRGLLIRHPLPEGWAEGAVNLMAVLSEIPIRSLDAMHIVTAQEIAAVALVTADRALAGAAEAAGLSVVRF